MSVELVCAEVEELIILVSLLEFMCNYDVLQ